MHRVSTCSVSTSCVAANRASCTAPRMTCASSANISHAFCATVHSNRRGAPRAERQRAYVADFYLEHALAAPLTTVAEQALWRRLASCARAYSVRWRDCLIDGERQRLVCRIEADDLSTARAAALCSGLEPDATWLSSVPVAGAPPLNGHAVFDEGSQAGLVDVVAEFRPDAQVDPAALARAHHSCEWCLDTLRVQPGPLVMSADGRRVLAFFRAPDAEAVRVAFRHSSAPFDRVTALRRIESSAGP